MQVIAVALALLLLFRDPDFRVPPVPLGVVSPVCGEVTEFAEATDPFLGRKSVKMSIRMQARGPYVLRSAIEGANHAAVVFAERLGCPNVSRRLGE